MKNQIDGIISKKKYIWKQNNVLWWMILLLLKEETDWVETKNRVPF